MLVECGKKSKGFCRKRSNSSNISSGKVCVKQESPRNKGSLVSGGLFLTVILGLDLMKCISDMHEALRLLYLPLWECLCLCSCCLSAVLLGSHVGNRRIYLQRDFCKIILSFSPDSLLPNPLPATICPFMWCSSLAGFFVICLVVCVSVRPCKILEGTLTWVPGTRGSCPSLDLGPGKVTRLSPPRSLWGLG